MEVIAPATLSRLLGGVYDCAIDPSLWPQTLGDIVEVYDAKMASIFVIEPVTQSIVFAHMWGLDIRQAAADAKIYNPINPLLTAGWYSQIDEPYNLRSFMDPEEFRCTRFYNEFMVRMDWFDYVSATHRKSAQRCTATAVAFNEKHGETTKRELEIMGLLAPHIRRALAIHETLDFKDCRLFDLRNTLDLAPNPILLLDDRGTLAEANRAAERFLSEQQVIRIVQGLLRFDDAEVGSRVDAALIAAARGQNSSGATIALRTSDSRAFAMEVLPLTSPIRQKSAGRAVLALFIQEIGAIEPLPGEVLVKLYGLTPAETRLLVLLAQNMTLREAAATLGVSEATVKTHLQHLFAKTGTSRQAEVIKLAMSALPRPITA